MRDTAYAKEIARADIGGHRIERLFIKGHGAEEIRFSWWKDGRMQTRPLDLPEHELLPLMLEAVRQGVFSSQFLDELYVGLTSRPRSLTDEFAEDTLVEMANLTERDTNVPGTIFVSTALDQHGPRVKWYPGKPGRQLPCLVMSIARQPMVREDFVQSPASRSVAGLLTSWVSQNHEGLLKFWNEGESWDRHEVSAFLDSLRPVGSDVP